MTQSEAILMMNQLGKEKIPFLFIIDFEMKNIIIEQTHEIKPQEILYSIGENYHNLPLPLSLNLHAKIPQNPILQKFPIDFQAYLPKFECVMRHIRQGDTYLVNLTCPTPIQINFSLEAIFFASTAKYKLWYKDQFVCFSPEIFVQIKENQLFSFPMKGTIEAAIPDAESIILADEKEKAEHTTIVDLIRNDLSTVADNVRVETFRYVEKIHTNHKDLLQISSKIVGDLPHDFHQNLGTLFFSLLPAGSICGAPKKKTVEIILEVEQYPRGFYTGVCGFFDGKNLDSGVMIRFIEQAESGRVFKSGGGITYKSQAQAEYQEMIDKVYVPIIRNHKSE
jgi:para-aminobenzoate synthetase component I